MEYLKNAAKREFRSIRILLTDMDDTLTHKGQLSAKTYLALERLRDAGILVIPTTAAPAGWCDQMARMWPVAGVIAENGGLFIRRQGGHGSERHYWHPEHQRDEVFSRLMEIAHEVQAAIPQARLADDQAFRLTSIAFSQPRAVETRAQVVAALRAGGADTTINNLWVLGWLGGYDKLTMARRTLAKVYGIDIDRHRDEILYSGDSTNDAPMFGFFRHTIGVATVREYLNEIPVPPNWITEGPGGDGFVEIADAVISAKES